MADLFVRREGKVGWIVLSNLTKQNALTYDIWRSMPEAVEQLERDPQVRVIAVRGDGTSAFSSGADVAELEYTRDSLGAISSYNRVVDEATEKLMTVSKPTVARIQGVCYGGGLAIALHCDLRLCSDDATFALPAARLGLGVSYSNTMRLAHLVGHAYCAEIMFTGKGYSASAALHMRLVNQVVPAAEFDRVFAEWCGSLADSAPLSIAAIKRTLIEGYKDADKRDMRAVNAMIDACYSSDDYREGRNASMQKRKPEFRGR